MGVGPRTGLIVMMLEDKIAVFQESLRNVGAYKSFFTTTLSFSCLIWLGVSYSVHYHHVEQISCVLRRKML
jgi:hypothetical protein